MHESRVKIQPVPQVLIVMLEPALRVPFSPHVRGQLCGKSLLLRDVIQNSFLKVAKETAMTKFPSSVFLLPGPAQSFIPSLSVRFAAPEAHTPLSCPLCGVSHRVLLTLQFVNMVPHMTMLFGVHLLFPWSHCLVISLSPLHTLETLGTVPVDGRFSVNV